MKETTHEIFDEKYDFKEPQNGVAKVEANQPVGLSMESLDSLDKMEAAEFDLSSEYWSPKLAGEQRRVIFDRIANSKVPSVEDDEILIDLLCVFMFVKENGVAKQICNASKRLVGTFRSIEAVRGQAFEITYEGKKKNATNSFQSDSWSIKPLFKK